MAVSSKKSKLKVAIVMGSDSDLHVIVPAVQRLNVFGVESDVRVISAHRTPDVAVDFAKNARSNGVGVIIAVAGKAAHLAGILAANTTVPVIGVPVKTDALDGMDALLSTVMMPTGVPVATVAIDGADNAAILALQILSLSDEDIATRLADLKTGMAAKTAKKDAGVAQKLAEML